MTANPDNLKGFKKYLYLVFGFVFLIIGIIGVFLPLLPTTPFILLSLSFFLKTNKKVHNLILNNKYFGKHIAHYKSGQGISMGIKAFAIAFLWITIIISIVFFIKQIYLVILLLSIAISVSIHILMLKNFKE